MNKKHTGLIRKYIVYKASTGEAVDNCFVLRPEKDAAAVVAIRAYALATDNMELANDLFDWVGRDKNYPLSIEEMQQMVESDFESGHIWIWDVNAKFSMPAIVDYHSELGVCGIYGAGEIEYTEESYGKNWIAYLKRPYVC